MKKFIVLSLFCAFIFKIQAQTELKINPLGLLFSSPDLSVEFAVAENIGIEPFIGVSFLKLTVDGDGYKSNGIGYGVNGKYYFSPDKGIDKFYAGIYMRGGNSKYTGQGSNSGDSFSRNYFGVGLSLGYKLVSRQNIVFDIGIGIGRKFLNKYSNASSSSVDISTIPLLNLDGFFRFGLGYRFGGGSDGSRRK